MLNPSSKPHAALPTLRAFAGYLVVWMASLGVAGAQSIAWSRTIATSAPAGERMNATILYGPPGESALYGVGGTTSPSGLPGATLADGGGQFFVVKYTPSGVRLWATSFGGPATGMANAVGADERGVWVCGSAYGSFYGATDPTGSAFLARFDHASGTLLGIDVFGTPRGDIAAALALDAGGVTVVGWTQGDLAGIGKATGATDDDAFVRRYVFSGSSPLGATPDWTSQFGGTDEQRARAVAVASSGGMPYAYVAYHEPVAVTGGSLVRAFVRRLRLDGTSEGMLTRELHGVGITDHPRSLAVDAGSLYVAGSPFGRTTSFVQKIDLDDLSDAWSFAVLNVPIQPIGNDSGEPISIEKVGGTLYVAGLRWPNMVVARYDAASGASLGPPRTFGTGEAFYTMGVTAGEAGVFVCGFGYQNFTGPLVATPSPQTDAFIVGFDAALTQPLFVVAEFGDTERPVGDQATAVASDGSVFVAGRTRGILPGSQTAGGDDAFVMKFDVQGNLVAAWQFGTSSEDYATAIAVDGSGVYVAGQASYPLAAETNIAELGVAPGGGAHAFVRKYSPEGTILWTHGLGLVSAPSDLAVHGADLYLGGTVIGPIPGQTRTGIGNAPDAYIVRLGTDGAFRWARQLGTGEWVSVRGVAADASGVAFAGELNPYSAWPGETPGGNVDAYVVKLAREDGAARWYDQWSTANIDRAYAIEAYDGALYACGGGSGNLFDPSLGTDSTYVPVLRRYDSASGAIVWTRIVSGSAGVNRNANADALAVDAGGIFLLGSTWGAFPGFANAGRIDAFATRFSHDGSPGWLLQWGTAYDDRIVGAAADAAGVYACGSVNDPAVAGDGFLVRIQQDEPPTAVASVTDPAGPEGVRPTGEVQCHTPIRLFGTASSDDNTLPTSLGFAWTLIEAPEGSLATLSGATTAMPEFVPDLVGTYVVQLVVADNLGQTSLPAVVVVSSVNLSPVADAGTNGITFVGQTITLDGRRSSDPNQGDGIASFAWSGRAPDGQSVTPTAGVPGVASYVPPLPGNYVFTLTVTDHCGASATATVEILVLTAADYAQGRIIQARELIATLPTTSVTTAGNQTSLLEFLRIATTKVAEDNLATARKKIEDTLERTDGCPERGAVDGNGTGMDYVTDCGTQAIVYALLSDALAALGTI